MKRLYWVYLCDDEAGEVEGMFSEDGSLLGWWFCDDAAWRNEYFAGFMAMLGVEVITEIPKARRTKLEKVLRKAATP